MLFAGFRGVFCFLSFWWRLKNRGKGAEGEGKNYNGESSSPVESRVCGGGWVEWLGASFSFFFFLFSFFLFPSLVLFLECAPSTGVSCVVLNGKNRDLVNVLANLSFGHKKANPKLISQNRLRLYYHTMHFLWMESRGSELKKIY